MGEGGHLIEEVGVSGGILIIVIHKGILRGGRGPSKDIRG